MHRTWWQNLQVTAPLSLTTCLERFRQQYRAQWREQVQQLDALERYFHEMHKLSLHHSQQAGGGRVHGFRVTGRRWNLMRSAAYRTSHEARWAAIAVAFSIVELERRHTPVEPTEIHQPVRRMAKGEKKNIPP